MIKDAEYLSTDSFVIYNAKFYVVECEDCVVREDGKVFRMDEYGLSPDSAFVDENNEVMIHFNVDHKLVKFFSDYFMKDWGRFYTKFSGDGYCVDIIKNGCVVARKELSTPFDISTATHSEI